MSGALEVTLQVNGRPVRELVEARTTLAELLRDRVGLTGTRLGCEHGVCGACTVDLDGRPARSCLVLAAQADGCAVRTVEALAPSATELSPTQEAFREAHGLQCVFCTSGMLMTVEALLREHPDPDDDTIRDWLHGNLCRCTGYQQVVESVKLAVRKAGAA